MAVAFPDTIVALSSGRLPSGVAVVRISGPQTRFAIETIAGSVPEARRAVLASFSIAGEAIDTGLILFFAAPASFTGEDVAEFHVHGGKASVAALLDALTSLPDVRHAEAGEFTRRAFLNGKLDLLGAEAMADIISAETEAQRRLAVHNAEGAQADLYAGWRKRLIHARAMIEAELDFADESDVPGSVAESVWADIAALKDELSKHIGGYHRAEIIRDGYDVVIVGAPNAGKSSLLNALAKRDAAIVSDEPGTTRDLVELSLDLDGLKVRLTDTAGIREQAGKVEAIGIDRALARARQADLLIHLVDLSGPGVTEIALPPVETLLVGTKSDLAGEQSGTPMVFDLSLSVKTGEGVEELLEQIRTRAVASAGDSGDVLPSRLRHVALLQQAAELLSTAISGTDLDIELRAEDLRQAAIRIGRISGAVDVEDLLDVIFSEFCIGK